MVNGEQNRVQRRTKSELGASLVEMSLLVALIALVSIHAITYFGEKAEQVMCKGKLLSADYSGDGKISSNDIAAHTGFYGGVTSANEHADLNCDDVVDNLDTTILINAL